MTKIYTFLMMAIVATLFASCDNRYWNDMEDREEAYTLEGTWTGYVDVYFNDRFGKRGDSYRTTMYFERTNNYGGWGYEVDYNMYSMYEDYYYCEFNWDVVNGKIRINYADSWNTCYIYDYSLTGSRFRGYLDDGTSKDIWFELSYDSRFDWGYWTRGVTRGGGDNDKVKASGEFANKK